MARKIIFNPLSGTFDYIDESSGGGGGGGDVDSVFGRTGDVVAQPDDYTWAQIDKTTSDIADITTKSHTSLSDIGTNSHADIDNHISDTDNPHDTTVANLDDTTIDTPVNRHALLHDGTDWKNRAITEADISDLDHYDSTDFDTDLSGKSTTDLSEGTNLYYTEARVSANTDVAANTSHRGTTTGNPHSVTKSDVGLGDVDNTSDTDKPVSTAQQAEIDTKADDSEVVKLTGDQTVAGIKTHSSFPVTPSSAPTTDYQVANKKYVDDNSGGGGSGDMEASVYDPAGGERQVAFEDELPDVSDFETTTELNARDTANRNRANHTGTQTMSTISDAGDLATKDTIDGVNSAGSIAINKATVENGALDVEGDIYSNGSRLGAGYTNTLYFTSSDDYEKPEGLNFIVVELVGGGGGGGRSGSTGSGEACESGGGGGGCYGRKKILASALDETESVSVGAGGSAGNPAGSGGTSSFGSHVTAGGGAGGQTMSSTSGNGHVYGGNGSSTSSGADLVIPGSNGGGARVSSGGTFWGRVNYGGASHLSGFVQATGNSSDGESGRLYGGGGSGSRNQANQPFRDGGAGADGIVIVHEHF